jgi:pimeloyl-ACP methyl ester carboxylesterase
MTTPFPEMPVEPPKFEIVGGEEDDGVLVRDIRLPLGDDEPIEAFLVEPMVVDARERRPGLLFAHWFDTEAPNGNWTEFRGEAVVWARRHRTAAILPQLTFPWTTGPTGSRRDRELIVREVTRLRRCLDLVAARPAVDPGRIGVVGHDFGAMHALLLGTVDRRPAAYVVIAAVPRWADWFLPFWPIEEDRIDYLREMRPLDPIEHVGRVQPARLLFQFGRRDFYIAPMTGLEFRRAAGEESEVEAYDVEHDMADPKALADRTAFLERVLRFA